MAALAISCGSDKQAVEKDGERALKAFRDFIATAFTSERQSNVICKFRADIRATGAVAEPWEGLLHVEMTWLHNGKPGSTHPYDLVFDHADASWTCSKTKSTSPNKSAAKACEAVLDTCARRLANNLAPPQDASVGNDAKADLTPRRKWINQKMEHRRRIHLATAVVDAALAGAVGEEERQEIADHVRQKVDAHAAKSVLAPRNREIVDACSQLIEKLRLAKKMIRARTPAEQIIREIGLSEWVASFRSLMSPTEMIEAMAKPNAGAAVTAYKAVGKMLSVSLSPDQVKRIFNSGRK